MTSLYQIHRHSAAVSATVEIENSRNKTRMDGQAGRHY